MNDNANLYMQTLKYNPHIGPYQCLALPWWIRTPYPTYYPHHRCRLEPINCGERVFRRIAGDIRRAKRSVDIITWGFDPGMTLTRGASAHDGLRYGDLLKEIATRKDNPVTVRLLVWHDDPLSQRQMKNIPGYYGRRFPAVGCASMGYYSESHQNYNADWFAQVCEGKFPNIVFRVRSVPASAARRAIEDEDVPGSLKAEVAKLYATHHQKMVLVDYELPERAVGYVMGHNSITDFWDTEEHIFRDPRRETFYRKDPALAWESGPRIDQGVSIPGYRPDPYLQALKEKEAARYLRQNGYVAKPYQDVSVRMQGSILFDLNHNFCDAWQQSAPPSSLFMEWSWLAAKVIKAAPVAGLVAKLNEAIMSMVSEKPDDTFIAQRKGIAPEAFRQSGWTHSAQLMRTNPLSGEKAIKECYANMMRQMGHYLFIQNQYIQYEAWVDHLKLCVDKLRSAGYKKPFYVFLLTSTPETDGMDLPTYDVVKGIGQSHTMVVEHNEAVEKARQGKGPKPLTPQQMAKQGINVVMGSLWTGAAAPKSAEDYEEIYIHAKVAIVDDAAFTIGSANLNTRSMAMDSELNVLSQDHELAYQLRCELFRQATGNAGPGKFDDMEKTFRYWSNRMAENLKHMNSLEPLENQLLPFHVNREPGAPVF